MSVDLDFFTETPFYEARLIERLSAIGTVQILQRAVRSVTGILDGVKFSFLGYAYPLVQPGDVWQGVSIASIEDIESNDAKCAQGAVTLSFDNEWRILLPV